jgi:hypothetical protein
MMNAKIIKFRFVLGCMPSSAVCSLIQRLQHNSAEPFLGPMRAEVHQLVSSFIQGKSAYEWKLKYNRNRSWCLPFSNHLQITYAGTAGAADGAGGGAAGTAADTTDPEEVEKMYK